MKVITAHFVRAAESAKDYPRGGLEEVAFAGRSNVGKSSTINTLLGRRNLVRTSKIPGRTQKLNFFLVNKCLIFVDLPGYGFAAVPLEVKRAWAPMIEAYLTGREELAGVVVIVDARRPATTSDLNLVRFLKDRGIPFVVAATKADKLTAGQARAQARSIEAQVGPEIPVVAFSALTGLGKNELWKEIKKFIE
jgi:GTP-binding protein